MNIYCSLHSQSALRKLLVGEEIFFMHSDLMVREGELCSRLGDDRVQRRSVKPGSGPLDCGGRDF